MAVTAVETSTIHSALMYVSATSGTNPVVETWSKVCCIKDYPDMGGTPSAIECTTLCDEQQRFVEGVKSGEQLSFTANYTASDYSAIQALASAKHKFGLWFGANAQGEPDGHDGKFEFEGTISVSLVGKGVDEVREMLITITPSTGVSFDTGATA